MQRLHPNSKKAHPLNPGGAPKIFFRSSRELSLRFVTLLCLIPVPLTLWLITLPSPTGWEDTPFGPSFWWAIPTILLALSMTLPASLFLIHDRYVLTFESSAAGGWAVTTFLLWGRRRREFTSTSLASADVKEEEGITNSTFTVSVNAPYLKVRLGSGKKLIFDRQCDAPLGWDAIEGVFRHK